MLPVAFLCTLEGASFIVLCTFQGAYLQVLAQRHEYLIGFEDCLENQKVMDDTIKGNT